MTLMLLIHNHNIGSEIHKPNLNTEKQMTSAEKARAGIPSIAEEGLFYIIVCVPKQFTPAECVTAAQQLGSPGLPSYYREGDEGLNGARQDVECVENENMKHVLLVY